MVFSRSDEREIRAVLKTDNWTGRWEQAPRGCPVSIWCAGEPPQRRVHFTALRGRHLFDGNDATLRQVLERIDYIFRAELDQIREHSTFVERPKRTVAPAKQHGPVTTPGNGTAKAKHSGRPTFQGIGLCKLLQWMGANGYTIYDASNCLEHHGLNGAISKKTISRAMDKGRHPSRDCVEVIELPEDVAAELEEFRDHARRQG